MTSAGKLAWLRRTTALLVALPLLWLAWQWHLLLTGEANALGANPVEYTIRWLGIGALRLLVVALAISPLANRLRLPLLIGIRRQIGLWAFAYATLHLLVYQAIDLEFSLVALLNDVAKRTFIAAGMAAFVLLLPLAATSTRRAIGWLGARRWQLLHRLVYPAGLLACLHFAFMVKGQQVEPVIYAALAGALILSRLLPKSWRIPSAK
jgi:methionine sulfoxide reductase heme-binding subunit